MCTLTCDLAMPTVARRRLQHLGGRRVLAECLDGDARDRPRLDVRRHLLVRSGRHQLAAALRRPPRRRKRPACSSHTSASWWSSTWMRSSWLFSAPVDLPWRYLSNTTAAALRDRPASIGAGPEQVGGIGDLGGEIALLRAAEVRIGQVALVVGEIGRPASALGALGDVAQIGQADRRVGVAAFVIGLDRHVRLGEAVGRDQLAYVADGAHGGGSRWASRSARRSPACCCRHRTCGSARGSRRPGPSAPASGPASRGRRARSASRAAATP